MNSSSREHAQAVSAALEQAALLCEQQEQGFLSPQYAHSQPWSSFSERFACRQCARAIRETAALISSAEQVEGRGPGMNSQ